MNDTTPQTPLRRWLLTLSLVLNLFLLAAIAGGAWRWWAVRTHDAPPVHARAAEGAAPAAPRGLRFAADGLAPERRQAFRAALRDARRDVAELVRQGREGRRELAQLMAAPVFDRAAFDATLSLTRAADLGVRERTERAVADFGAGLTPAERATFAQALASAQGSFRVPPANPATPAAPAAATTSRP
ncbi:MAG: periplasmic heavy metal sensor [Bordetella sp.]|nr:periplasmic heavy metal sensor [Pseudomonadota bacterium]